MFHFPKIYVMYEMYFLRFLFSCGSPMKLVKLKTDQKQPFLQNKLITGKNNHICSK